MRNNAAGAALVASAPKPLPWTDLSATGLRVMAKVTSLCVYCGSSAGNDGAYHDAARRLGQVIAENGIRLIYGGGRVGLMGVIADAVLAGGGAVTGIIPGHLQQREVGHHGLTELFVVGSMHERKARMSELADAFVVLPGGLGTLDETFEIITWKQLRLHDKPIALVDVGGYWRPLLDLVAAQVKAGFVHAQHAELFTVVSSVDEVIPALAASPEPHLTTDAEHM
jgi:uncharacterized protein (TIGR00730 family)